MPRRRIWLRRKRGEIEIKLEIRRGNKMPKVQKIKILRTKFDQIMGDLTPLKDGVILDTDPTKRILRGKNGNFLYDEEGKFITEFSFTKEILERHFKIIEE